MVLKFFEVAALFADGNRPATLKCITETRKSRCIIDLEPNQLSDLHNLLLAVHHAMTLKCIRNIIDCLLCTRHLNSYHKKKVETGWQIEFQDIDFSTDRSSPSSGRSTPRRRSVRSSNPISSTAAVTPRNSPRADSAHSLSPIPAPNFHTSRSRNSSASNLPAIEQLVASSDQSPAVYINELDLVADSSQSSAVARAGISYHDLASQTMEVDGDPPEQLPEERALASEDDRDSEYATALETIGQESNSQQQPVSPRAPAPHRDLDAGNNRGRFGDGEASAWAPWTVRKATLRLIHEPLLDTRATGYIYVAQVANISRTIVKIGRTLQTPRERIREIARQHQICFNMGTFWNSDPIPALQLERLERLVHSDLAYFQKNWLVATDRSQKTHHEYFEVDLATASQTVQTWVEIVENLDLKPGIPPDGDLFRSLRSDAELSVYTADESDVEETWKRIHEDHNRRINLWTRHLNNQSHLHRSSYKAVWWICGSIFMWALLDRSIRTWYIILLFAAPSCMWNIFAGS